MITVTLTQAKKDFEALVAEVQEGETVIVTFGRNKTPVAKLMAVDPTGK